ncbi:MAG: metallopeptidase TldD-related protein [Acidobacteriota bacterium]
MNGGGSIAEVLDRLSRSGWREVEAFHKKGRSRTMRFTPYSDTTSLRQEEGWSVRAGDQRRSFFYAASGTPDPGVPWPEADGAGLRLPSARPGSPWSAPSNLDAPLIGEGEARGFFSGLARELDNELAGARLLSGYLDDGSSESHLLSSREVATTVRHRVASLHLEAVGSGTESTGVVLDIAERDARRFSPAALARRLADLILVAEKRSSRSRDRGELLLAPVVASGLLAALSDLWIGPNARQLTVPLIDRNGRIGSPALTLIDNGRLPGSVLEAPFDGEGQPTRKIVLVEQGSFRQPLLAWWQCGSNPKLASGCSLRPGWRDLPRPSATHLYLEPDRTVRAAELIQNLTRGYYLIGLDGPPRIHSDYSRFAAPVRGFAIAGGKPTGTVARVWLVGSVSTLLNGIVSKARDLTFSAIGGGMVGSPTVLVKGLELRQQT